MRTLQNGAKIISIIMIGAVLALFVATQRNNRITQTKVSASLPVVTPFNDNNGIIVMDSPDGSKTLTLKKQKNVDLTSYSLFVSLKSGEQKQQIYKTEKPSSKTLLIPFNTWSPNNAYFFIKEITPPKNNYFVFQSSGSLFPNNLAFLSVRELFKKKVPNYIIEDVTGWADPNLLVINTKSVEGDKKVSFWLEIPSQSFIQLGTYFK